jgi:hypothetical protein
MAKGKRQKDKQYKSKENDKTTNNIMANGKRQKDKQYNGQRKKKKRQTV